MNPYQPPAAPPSPNTLAGVGCPKCNGADVHSPKFTWWGGALGPKMLKHTVCRSCGFGFNRDTRQSNQTAITIYVVVATILSIAIVVALQMMR